MGSAISRVIVRQIAQQSAKQLAKNVGKKLAVGATTGLASWGVHKAIKEIDGK